MNRLLQRRRILLIVSTTAVLLLVFLAAGLSDLRFAPARPLDFGGGQVRSIQDVLGDIARRFSAIPFGQQLLLLGAFVALAALSLAFMSPGLRKRLLRMLFRMTFVAVALLYFFDNFSVDERAALSENLAAPIQAPAAGGGTVLPPQVFRPPQVPAALTYAVTLTLALIFVASAWWLGRLWMRSRQAAGRPLQEFARIARTSLDDLSSGAQWENVIVRCYLQMEAVARERRGLRRQEAMTPREFGRYLETAGLPADPVRRLTRLFERVRYGAHAAGQNEVDEAVSCLNDIAACFGERL